MSREKSVTHPTGELPCFRRRKVGNGLDDVSSLFWFPATYNGHKIFSELIVTNTPREISVEQGYSAISE